MSNKKPKKTDDWEKEFDELLFPECPTEEGEPFFWRWKNSGRATLITFIKTLLQEKEKEIREEIYNTIEEKCYQEGFIDYHDLESVILKPKN